MKTTAFLTPFFFLGKKASRFFLTSIGLMLLVGCSNQAVGNEIVDTTVVQNDGSSPKESIVADNIVVENTEVGVANTLVLEDQIASAETTPVDIEIGLTYAEARTRLLQQGWMPDEQPDPGPYGVERTMYDVGFTEVAGCAGSGAGQCRFDFYHPDRMALGEENLLSVITYGGSRPEVADWNIQSVASTESRSTGTEMAVVQATIPIQFHGLWNANIEGCSDPSSDGRMLVETDHLDFYETSGPVTEVIVQGDLEVTVYSELSGEGSTWTDITKLELSGDHNVLTLIRDGFESARYRCLDEG